MTLITLLRKLANFHFDLTALLLLLLLSFSALTVMLGLGARNGMETASYVFAFACFVSPHTYVCGAMLSGLIRMHLQKGDQSISIPTGT